MLSLYLLTTILFGVVSGAIARSKGRSFLIWLLAGLLIGPFALIVATLPSRPREGQLERCPACAEPILNEAQVCRFCGSHLEWSSEP